VVRSVFVSPPFVESFLSPLRQTSIETPSLLSPSSLRSLSFAVKAWALLSMYCNTIYLLLSPYVSCLPSMRFCLFPSFLLAAPPHNYFSLSTQSPLCFSFSMPLRKLCSRKSLHPISGGVSDFPRGKTSNFDGMTLYFLLCFYLLLRLHICCHPDRAWTFLSPRDISSSPYMRSRGIFFPLGPLASYSRCRYPTFCLPPFPL